MSANRTLYRTWYQARRRCHDPNAPQWKWYGGRGIAMCERWREDSAAFIDWVLTNLGPRPEGHSLDRIDGNRGYEPGNIRWADALTQGRNKRPRQPILTAEEKRAHLRDYMRVYRTKHTAYMNDLSRRSYAKLSADPEWRAKRNAHRAKSRSARASCTKRMEVEGRE